MLDSSYNAKLVDQGRGLHTTVLAGTLGYMDPECVITGKACVESDVYSFGVVLLGVAFGRKPAVVLPDEDEGAVVRLAQLVWDQRYGRGRPRYGAADLRLNGEFDGQAMERVLGVGLWCAHPNRAMRPSIRQAFSVLRCGRRHWSSAPSTNSPHPDPATGVVDELPSLGSPMLCTSPHLNLAAGVVADLPLSGSSHQRHR
ncbi:hypothetical protein E2562_029279 [Oryza meyeriana var. granulata]|uniref:Protein kinase domain-containing protein n=1 Tax=Oryza meyeriana var. granulata TaxID=110450 RepID=A0A6G1BMM2_9ORYZ|nr:hypothetical protein E2562_029279 [Oryza meyeriana var. granulata]